MHSYNEISSPVNIESVTEEKSYLKQKMNYNIKTQNKEKENENS